MTTSAYTAAKIVEAVATDRLRDDGFGTWGENLLLRGVARGQWAIVSVRPDANTERDWYQFTAGTTQLPSETAVHAVLDVYQTKSAVGAADFRSIRLGRRNMFDALDPDWRSTSAVAQPTHFVFDDRDRERFEVFPPADGNGYYDALVSLVPGDVTQGSDTLTLRDTYIPALEEFVVWYVTHGDSDTPELKQMAETAWNRFLQLLEVDASSALAASVKTREQLR